MLATGAGYSSLRYSRLFLQSLRGLDGRLPLNKGSYVFRSFGASRRRQVRKPQDELDSVQQPVEYVPMHRMKLREVLSFQDLKSFAKHYLSIYRSLAKPKLSMFVVMSQALGFFMAPTPSLPDSAPLSNPALGYLSRAFEALLLHVPGVSSSTSASLSTLFSDTMLLIPSQLPGYVALASATLVGTSLCVASANTFNQWLEWPFDAQMARTRNRMLVQYKISTGHAFTAAVVFMVAGVATLALCANFTVAALGLCNIFLYAGVYTPMKRLSIYNTWIGAIVGGIPPLMGWAAATNGSLTDFPVDAGAWVLFYLLYAWQFPHFNSLSWNLQQDYTRAGYRMMSVLNPQLCTRTALTYSLALVPLCSIAAPICGLTSSAFAASSLAPNLYMLYRAVKFRRNPSRNTARALFFASLLHLPVVCALLLLHNQREKSLLDSASRKSDVSSDVLHYPWVKSDAAMSLYPKCIYEEILKFTDRALSYIESAFRGRDAD